MIKRFGKSLLLAMVAWLMLASVCLAAWEFMFPATITDSTSTSRVMYPIMLGYGGQGFVDAGLIKSTGLDTNMEVDGSDIKYMLSTTNCTAVIPTFPAGGTVEADLYTGYTPEQSGFPIIVGDGGYMSITDNASLEMSDNFSLKIDGYFVVDFTNYTNRNVWYKEGAITIAFDASGNLTATIPTAPTVEATNTSTMNVQSQNHIVSLPAGINAGDLLIVLFGGYIGGGGGDTITSWSAGWTQLAQGSNANEIAGAAYRIADGGEGATITVTTGTNNVWSAHQTFRISGYSGTPEISAAASGNSANPNSASLSPSWGAAPNLWFSFFGGGTNAARTVNSYPTNYASGVLTRSTAGFAHTASARRSYNAASDDPGQYVLDNALQWRAWTIAVRPGELSVTASGMLEGDQPAEVSANTTHLNIYLNSILQDSEALNGASVPDTSNNITVFQNNVMTYCDNLTLEINGTQVLYYAPNQMLSGAIVPDREGYDHYGTISWGSNNGTSISYGAMTSYEDYTASAAAAGGFDMPTSPLPATWFNPSSDVSTSLPFYDSFSEVSAQTGKPVQMYYALAIFGVAFGVFIALTAFTRSALMGFVAMLFILVIGSSMTIIPWWIIFAMLLTGIGIMYLHRQVAT